jgi:hypothetical protein
MNYYNSRITKEDVMEEKKYPIYFTGASWKQDGLDYDNGTGFSKMYKDDPGIAVVRQTAIEWIERILSGDKYKDKNCELVRLDCKLVELETWCCHWFNHYTFNTHLSDNELRLSLSSFVDRKKDKSGDEHSLMGAEDSYRWKGPCRCDKCQERGVVYIDH